MPRRQNNIGCDPLSSAKPGVGSCCRIGIQIGQYSRVSCRDARIIAIEGYGQNRGAHVPSEAVVANKITEIAEFINVILKVVCIFDPPS